MLRIPFLNRKATKPTGQRMLEGASGKRWKNVPTFGATGQEVLAGAPQVRSRARHLRFNDSHAANAAEIIKTALVGYGAVAASAHDDCDCRDCQDSDFSAWAAKAHFPALQTEIADALVTDGEAILVLRQSETGELDLQHIPAEQLDESHTVELGNGNYIAAGIEYDQNDRPVAYHFRPARPTDQFQTFRDPIRVPAEDVIHIFRRQGAAQTRGLSWFAPCVIAINEKSQLKDAMLVNQKIQSMMVGFITDQNSVGGQNPFDDGEAPDLSLEPGTMRILPGGYDVKFSTPQQAQQATEIAASALREIACGLQIPEFLLSGDMRGVNYSSARTALVQFRAHIEAIQHTLLVPAFDRIWARWNLLESLRGNNHADTGTPCEWHFSKPQWVDPKSDAVATKNMLEMGLISRRQAVAQLGYDVTKIDAEIASDLEREQSLGLSFGHQKNKGNP